MVPTDDAKRYEKATFAGGCFWCMQPAFKQVQGVVGTTVGYTGGTGKNPTYQDYADKGYVEALEVTYDPRVVTYDILLDTFWHNIDPTDAGGQFADRGAHYRSAIFYHTSEQQKKAQRSKERLAKSGIFKKPIVTEIIKAMPLYPAEEYHQEYARKNPAQYKAYRSGSGRSAFLEKMWGEQSHSPKEAVRKRLTPLQYEVTQQNKTEQPFANEYWDNKQEGIYVDVVSGQPLFSSRDKFDSGTGWPSFTKPLTPAAVSEKEDRMLAQPRTEVRSTKADSHLGHIFPDGPAEKGGLRYCINSAALRFISVEDLEKEGYGEYKSLFTHTIKKGK